MDTDVTRGIASDTGASFFGTTRSRFVGQQQRNWRLLLTHLLYSLGSALQPTNILTYVVFYNFCRLLQFLGQPTASALGHLLHRVFQSSGWPIKSPLTFFPTTPDHGAHDCVVPLCLQFDIDIELRDSGVIPLHEAPWTGCLGV